MKQADVVIVGAGPVGLTLAIALGRQGIRCIIIERKESPEFLPKMERCNARTMEIYRRMGLAEDIRQAGLAADIPMDVYVILAMNREPILHLAYPSVADARNEIAACNDGSMPLEPYQLISQYTLEPVLKRVAEALPSVSVCFGTRFTSFEEAGDCVVANVEGLRGPEKIKSRYLVGCDGGGSTVRKQLGISLKGEGDLLRLRQALFYCEDLYDRIPLGNGPGTGRHYHVADDASSFLIMQDSTRHWTLHAVVEDDAAMARQFEQVVGEPVDYEMLYVGEWKQNLLLADAYRRNNVFLAGDAAHLVIPTGGLGMNTGVGDAIDLAWKLTARIQGWGGSKLLDSYEIERRQVGDRNVGASRYASQGRRRWRKAFRPELYEDSRQGQSARRELAALADIEQRKTNEMIGAELGYRYVGSPVIAEEPGGPELLFRDYQPTTWPGARLPHMWLDDGTAVQDIIPEKYVLLQLASGADGGQAIVDELRRFGAPCESIAIQNRHMRDTYGFHYILLRPDMHVAWRGNRPPDDPRSLAALVTGH